MKFRFKSVLFPICATVAALIFSGCAGYKLGPSNGMVAGEQSIEIYPFQNKTIEPRLSEYVTQSLRKRLQQDGTFKLETQGDSDVVVNGIITRFYRSELSFQPSDVRTVRDYYLMMTAEITATDRNTGKIILTKQISGRTSIRVGSDLTSAERQAIPLLADDMARNATAALVDGTW